MTRAVAILLLAGAYVLTLASLHPIDFVIGIAISAAVLAGLHSFLLADPPLPARELLRRAARLPAFCLVILREVIVGTWQVAVTVVGVRRLAQPGIVQVPIGERTPNGVAVAALTITLSPGEVLIDVDWARGVMLIHVIDASDPDGIRARHADIYERFQRGVFP